MQEAPRYADVVGRGARLSGRARARPARRPASPASASCIDPGFGFGKTLAHNLALAARAARRSRRRAIRCSRACRASRRWARSPAAPVGERLAGERCGGARGGGARRGDRPRARRARDGRRAEGLAAVDPRTARTRRTSPCTRFPTASELTMTQQHYFGTDGVRGRVGEPPITPELVLKLGWAAGRVLAADTRARRRAPARADRQGHAHLGLHARGGAGGGPVRRRRRRLALRAAADARGRLPDARAAAVRRHRDQRVAQSASTTTASSSSPAPAPSCPTTIEQAIERGMADAARLRALGGARQGAPHRRRRRPLHRVLQGHVPVGPRPQGLAHRRRLRARRRLPRRAAGVPRARRRGRSRSAPSPNGININDGVGATHPQTLKRRCVEHSADLGIALDGDGDRLVDGRPRGRALRRRPAALRDRARTTGGAAC